MGRSATSGSMGLRKKRRLCPSRLRFFFGFSCFLFLSLEKQGGGRAKSVGYCSNKAVVNDTFQHQRRAVVACTVPDDSFAKTMTSRRSRPYTMRRCRTMYTNKRSVLWKRSALTPSNMISPTGIASDQHSVLSPTRSSRLPQEQKVVAWKKKKKDGAMHVGIQT